MAKPGNSIPAPVVGPSPSVSVKPAPTISNYDLNLLFPPVTNSALPSPKVLDKVGASRQHVLRTAKPGDPLPYAFGRTKIRPTVIGADDSGDYLVLDLMWGVGEMQRVCNGIVPSIDPPGTWDYSVQFPDLGTKLISGSQFEHFTGTAGQSASSIMTALKGSYPAYPGIAHSVITMQPGWNLNIVATCDAVKVIDPRTSPHTTVWTQNPALILADMLVRCGYTMDYSSVADAANYCDELTGSDSPQIERWKIAGVIYDRADLQSWIHTMAQYAHCFVDKSGSTFFLRPDKPRSSNHTVTADDMVEGSASLKLRSKRNTVDGVRVTYGFNLRTLDAEFGTLTDPGTVAHLSMPFWRASFPYLGSHAKRHAEEVYNKSQLEIESLEFVTFDKALERTVGDVGTITNAALGLSAREMALIDVQQASPGRWRLRYADYSASVYPDTSYTLTYNDTDIQNPYGPGTGPTPSLDWTYNAASPQQPILTLSWTGVSWAYIKDYYVRVYSVTSPEVVIYDSADHGYVDHASGTITLDLSDTVVSFGTTYRADVYRRSIVDAVGDTPGTDTVTVNDALLWNDTPRTIYGIVPDAATDPYASLEFFFDPATMEYGNLPALTWTGYEPAFASGGYPNGTGEYLLRVDHVSTVSGTGISILEIGGTNPGQTGLHGQWLEFWDYYQIDLPDTTANSVAEHIVIDVSLAPNDGTGNPITGRVKTKRMNFVAYKGSNEFDVFDNFTGTNGTNLTAHTPDVQTVSPGGWTALSGTFEIQSNEAESIGGAAAYSIDAPAANFEVAAEVAFNGVSGGIIGRVQDASNYWKLEITSPNGTSPVLNLVKVVAGSPTTVDSFTITDNGSLSTGQNQIQLYFDGNTIRGKFVDISTGNFPIVEPVEVSTTDSTFNTESACGIIAAGAGVEFNRFSVSDLEITLLP